MERKKCQRIARFRLENGIRSSKYWEEEDKRKCRVCEWEVETWEHAWKNVQRGDERKNDKKRYIEILGEGKRKGLMIKSEEIREGKGERRIGENE